MGVKPSHGGPWFEYFPETESLAGSIPLGGGSNSCSELAHSCLPA